MGNSAAVQSGPGLLYVAPVGTTEPTTASAALPSAWREVGYTEDGNAFSYEITNEGLEVAEEFDVIRYNTTGRNASVTFQMAETTRANFALALNKGANEANDNTPLEPPDPGDEVRVMIVLNADSGARWIYRQCLQAGTTEIANRKAPQKRLIAVTFRLEKPTGLAPFRVIPTGTGLL